MPRQAGEEVESNPYAKVHWRREANAASINAICIFGDVIVSAGFEGSGRFHAILTIVRPESGKSYRSWESGCATCRRG
jgi:hypothetical protein